eukprot:TRINITY_DN1394_c0_g1_i2.p1 TRINITY_DN1394_c0_g1~~TRINITY_DN1394_c0_g1_i2.p1  ORF type:complete len:287 (+),score=23.72 TRINITY_DN1394_c0_g1_i2:110-970(+)
METSEVPEITALTTAKFTVAFSIPNFIAYSTIFILAIYHHKYSQRTDRLFLYLCSGGIIQDIGSLGYFAWLSYRLEAGQLCAFVGFLYNWSDVCYSFWTTTTCIYVFSKGIFGRDHRLFEFLTGFYSYGLSLAITLQGLNSDPVIYGPIDDVWCWISDDYAAERISQHHVWVWLALLFVAGSLTAIFIKWHLLKKKKLIEPQAYEDLTIVTRDLLPYQIIFLVCYFPRFVGWLQILLNGGRWNYYFYNFSIICVLMTGMLNLAVFLYKIRKQPNRPNEPRVYLFSP